MNSRGSSGYSVRLSKRAERYLEHLDAATLRRVMGKISEIADDPQSSGTRMKGSPERWKARIGSLRLVYVIDRAQLVVWVLTVRPRGEVYKRLR